MANFLPKLIFKLGGWKLKGSAPTLKKFVIIGAPHTSNWDFVYGLCAWKLYGIDPRYLIKKELYFFPLNLFFSATGGLPVDRSRHNNLTDAIIDMIKQKDELAVLITPEGTRKLMPRWKTSFYYIALGAGIPIVMGSMDYKKRETNLSEPFWPTGDIEKDFLVFKEFYRNITPKNPEGFNPENIKPG